MTSFLLSHLRSRCCFITCSILPSPLPNWRGTCSTFPLMFKPRPLPLECHLEGRMWATSNKIWGPPAALSHCLTSPSSKWLISPVQPPLSQLSSRLVYPFRPIRSEIAGRWHRTLTGFLVVTSCWAWGEKRQLPSVCHQHGAMAS